MKPAFTLHRSIIFWAGLLVIIFTCLAWRDSCQTVSLIQWRQLTVNSVDRGITVTRDIGARHGFRAGRSLTNPYPDGWQSEFFPPPFLVRPDKTFDAEKSRSPTSLQEMLRFEVNYSNPGSWAFYLPYWLHLLAFLIPWSLLLLWRIRRQRKTVPSELPKHPPRRQDDLVKFTLHRSIIFWAGILVIAFTCWAWIDSRSHQSRIFGKQLTAASCNHGILITRQVGATFHFGADRSPSPSPNDPYRGPFLVRSRATYPGIPDETPPLKEWCQMMVDHFPLGTWTFYLPYWLILPPLILTWLALLLCRARRLKRAHPLTAPS